MALGQPASDIMVAMVAMVVALASAETLYNGIVLPSEWPPRINLTNHTTISEPW